MRRIIFIFELIFTAWSHPLNNPFGYTYPLAYPYGEPYSDVNFGYNYAPQLQTYSSHIPTITNEYIQDYAAATGYSVIPEVQPTLNIMAELPYAVSNEFSVVPMFIVAKDTMNMVSQGHITSVSQEQPVMTVKGEGNNVLQCTPAVRMVLEKPIVVNSLKSNVLFPSEVQILHDGVKIPIRIGAVIAPALPQTYVSQETPLSIKVVYAIPTKPIKITITIEQEGNTIKDPQTPNQQLGTFLNIDQGFPDVTQLPNSEKQHQFSGTVESKPPSKEENLPFPTQQRPNGGVRDPAFNGNIPPALEDILQNQNTAGSSGNAVFGALSNKPDYVNNADAVFVPNQEAVVVESEADLPPRNVTVIDFPLQEAEPHLEVDEEDEELINRNPPLVLAPAGIVQSTQPESHVEAFHNDKESPYLETLREQAKKKL